MLLEIVLMFISPHGVLPGTISTWVNIYRISNKYSKQLHDIRTNIDILEEVCAQGVGYGRSTISEKLTNRGIERCSGVKRFPFKVPETDAENGEYIQTISNATKQSKQNKTVDIECETKKLGSTLSNMPNNKCEQVYCQKCVKLPI